MAYTGPDRRIHRIFVTRNSEYHVRRGVCIAVRRLTDPELTVEHPAIGSSVVAGIGYCEERGCRAYYGMPEAGDQICFSNDVLSSPVRKLARPSRELVATYDS